MDNKTIVAGLMTLTLLANASPFVCNSAMAGPGGAASFASGLLTGAGRKVTNPDLAIQKQQALVYLSQGRQLGEQKANPILAQAIAEGREKLVALHGEKAVAKMSDQQILGATAAK